MFKKFWKNKNNKLQDIPINKKPNMIPKPQNLNIKKGKNEIFFIINNYI